MCLLSFTWSLKSSPSIGDKSPVLLTAYVRQMRSAKFAIIFFFSFLRPSLRLPACVGRFLLVNIPMFESMQKTASLFFRLPVSFACYAARCTEKGITAGRFRLVPVRPSARRLHVRTDRGVFDVFTMFSPVIPLFIEAGGRSRPPAYKATNRCVHHHHPPASQS